MLAQKKHVTQHVQSFEEEQAERKEQRKIKRFQKQLRSLQRTVEGQQKDIENLVRQKAHSEFDIDALRASLTSKEQEARQLQKMLNKTYLQTQMRYIAQEEIQRRRPPTSKQ